MLSLSRVQSLVVEPRALKLRWCMAKKTKEKKNLLLKVVKRVKCTYLITCTNTSLCYSSSLFLYYYYLQYLAVRDASHHLLNS